MKALDILKDKVRDWWSTVDPHATMDLEAEELLQELLDSGWTPVEEGMPAKPADENTFYTVRFDRPSGVCYDSYCWDDVVCTIKHDRDFTWWKEIHPPRISEGSGQ